MQITSEKHGAALIVKPAGRLDATNAEELTKVLLDAFDTGEDRVVVDLVDLEYISSAGLRSLLVGAKRASAKGGKIVLCRPEDYVKEVFDVAGFSAIFSIYDSTEAALAALG
jgi:anti-anti-sigma factor